MMGNGQRRKSRTKAPVEKIPFLVALNPPHIAALVDSNARRRCKAMKNLKTRSSASKSAMARSWSEPDTVLARVYPVKSVMPALQTVDVIGVFERAPLLTSYHEVRTHEDIFDQIQG